MTAMTGARGGPSKAKAGARGEGTSLVLLLLIKLFVASVAVV